MKKLSLLRFLALFLLLQVVLAAAMSVPGLAQHDLAPAQSANPTASGAAGKDAQAKSAEFQVFKALIPTRVLVQGPAEADIELQIICLFESAPENTLHGSLVEANGKLKGLLD